MRCPCFIKCPYIYYNNLNYCPILNYYGMPIKNTYSNRFRNEDTQLTSEDSANRANPQGWVSSGGKWYYYENGVKAKGWKYLYWSNGTKQNWFYFDSNGVMATGWKKLKWSGGTDWFYFDNNGAMVTGWKKLKWSGGTDWFYFYSNGVMAHDTTIDGHKIGSNGVASV